MIDSIKIGIKYEKIEDESIEFVMQHLEHRKEIDGKTDEIIREKCFYNHENGYYRIDVKKICNEHWMFLSYEPAMFFRKSNLNAVSEDEFKHSIHMIEDDLKNKGFRNISLREWKVSKIDIFKDIIVNEDISKYIRAFHQEFPRLYKFFFVQNVYDNDNSIYYKNGKYGTRILKFYNKIRQLKEKYNGYEEMEENIIRVEYSLRKQDTIKLHIEVETLGDLLKKGFPHLKNVFNQYIDGYILPLIKDAKIVSNESLKEILKYTNINTSYPWRTITAILSHIKGYSSSELVELFKQMGLSYHQRRKFQEEYRKINLKNHQENISLIEEFTYRLKSQ